MANQNLQFQEIYNSFQPKILQYLTRLIGVKEEAEDLTHDVFIKVNNGLDAFKGKSNLSTWIYKIATNVAIDRLRSLSFGRVRKQTVSDELDSEKEEDMNVWTGEKELSMDQKIIRNEMNECIRDFIGKLSPDYKTLIVLSELEGLKNQEIADVLGITLDTVKIRLHRAREKLRAALESNCNFYRTPQNELACDLKSAFAEFKKSY